MQQVRISVNWLVARIARIPKKQSKRFLLPFANSNQWLAHRMDDLAKSIIESSYSPFRCNSST